MSLGSWSPRRVPLPASPGNTLQSSVEPANSAPFISSTRVSHSIYPPALLAEHTSPLVSYDPERNNNLSGGVCRSQLEDTGTSKSFAMATVFGNNSTDIAEKISPQDNTTSHEIRTMSLDSVTGLSGDQEQGWAMVTTHPCDTDGVHTSPLEQLGCDEPELVPLDSPLGSSFEDLGPASQALYHTGLRIPIVTTLANRPHYAEVKERKKRGQFSEVDRQATSVTRGVGACMRCRAQRIRVRGLLPAIVSVFAADVLAVLSQRPQRPLGTLWTLFQSQQDQQEDDPQDPLPPVQACEHGTAPLWRLELHQTFHTRAGC